MKGERDRPADRHDAKESVDHTLSARECKALSRKRKAAGTLAPGRVQGATYETRPIPGIGVEGYTYEHELSPSNATERMKLELEMRRRPHLTLTLTQVPS